MGMTILLYTAIGCFVAGIICYVIQIAKAIGVEARIKFLEVRLDAQSESLIQQGHRINKAAVEQGELASKHAALDKQHRCGEETGHDYGVRLIEARNVTSPIFCLPPGQRTFVKFVCRHCAFELEREVGDLTAQQKKEMADALGLAVPKKKGK